MRRYTRVSDVERIFMTFGKLGGDPIEFLSRPYEECLSGIAVTHMPRYLIDMRLGEGETIFDKMGISYDDLRTRDNPIAPVSKYYRSQLKKGESLWWAADQVEEPVSATVKLWSALSKDEKDRMVVRGMVYFPELFGPTSPTKYNRYCLWLITQGIVNPNVRDGFSAGGQVPIRTYSGGIVKMPAVYGRILKYAEYIRDIINDTDCKVLEEYWNDDIEENRLSQWAKMASSMATNDLKVGYNKADKVFESIFPELRRKNMYEAKHRFSKVAESSTEYGAKSKSNNYEAEVVTLRKGQKVRHKAYGMCMITAIEDDRIWVKHNNDFETGVNDYTYEEFGEMFEIIN